LIDALVQKKPSSITGLFNLWISRYNGFYSERNELNMQELFDWIEEKLSHRFETIYEPVSITYDYKKQAGVNQSAKLSIDIKPAEEFSLEIESFEGDEVFHSAIKNALFGFLMGRTMLPLLGVNIRIYDIKSDPLESSYLLFLWPQNRV